MTRTYTAAVTRMNFLKMQNKTKQRQIKTHGGRYSKHRLVCIHEQEYYGHYHRKIKTKQQQQRQQNKTHGDRYSKRHLVCIHEQEYYGHYPSKDKTTTTTKQNTRWSLQQASPCLYSRRGIQIMDNTLASKDNSQTGSTESKWARDSKPDNHELRFCTEGGLGWILAWRWSL